MRPAAEVRIALRPLSPHSYGLHLAASASAEKCSDGTRVLFASPLLVI